MLSSCLTGVVWTITSILQLRRNVEPRDDWNIGLSAQWLSTCDLNTSSLNRRFGFSAPRDSSKLELLSTLLKGYSVPEPLVLSFIPTSDAAGILSLILVDLLVFCDPSWIGRENSLFRFWETPTFSETTCLLCVLSVRSPLPPRIWDRKLESECRLLQTSDCANFLLQSRLIYFNVRYIYLWTVSTNLELRGIEPPTKFWKWIRRSSW